MVRFREGVRAAIIDYGSGNIKSVKKAVEKVIRGSLVITNDPKELANATHLILPGVGAFMACRQSINKVTGLIIFR